MSKKIMLNIVIVLGILIIFSFIALIYGIYNKIYNTSSDFSNQINNISLNLDEEEEILDISVIDENTLLIKIKDSENIVGGIYNIRKKEITEFIEK